MKEASSGISHRNYRHRRVPKICINLAPVVFLFASFHSIRVSAQIGQILCRKFLWSDQLRYTEITPHIFFSSPFVRLICDANCKNIYSVRFSCALLQFFFFSANRHIRWRIWKHNQRCKIKYYIPLRYFIISQKILERELKNYWKLIGAGSICSIAFINSCNRYPKYS